MKYTHIGTRTYRRLLRRRRVRTRISGTRERPRLSVFRSLRGLYAQVIDDASGRTVANAGNVSGAPVSGDAGGRGGKVAQAYLLGKMIAEKAASQGITHVVFDRGGYAYHGRVKALAEGARDGGLQF